MMGKLQQEQISESDWKGNFRVSMKSFYELLMYKITPMFQKKQNCLRSPMSVKVSVAKAP